MVLSFHNSLKLILKKLTKYFWMKIIAVTIQMRMLNSKFGCALPLVCQPPSEWHLRGESSTGSRAGHLPGKSAGSRLFCGRLYVASNLIQSDQGYSSTQRCMREPGNYDPQTLDAAAATPFQTLDKHSVGNCYWTEPCKHNNPGDCNKNARSKTP